MTASEDGFVMLKPAVKTLNESAGLGNVTDIVDDLSDLGRAQRTFWYPDL